MSTDFDQFLERQQKRHRAMMRGAIAGWLIWQFIRLCALVAVILMAMYLYNQIF